jgi:hypothetical protein
VPKPGWLGLGSSGAVFLDHSVLIPAGAKITGITLNIKDEVATPVTGTVYVRTASDAQAVTTGILATVSGTNPPNWCATGTGKYEVKQCALLSVEITASQALQHGAAAVIYLSLS